MKTVSKPLREHAMEIINFNKKKMKLYQTNSRNYMKMQNFVIFVKKIEDKHAKDKNYTGKHKSVAYSIQNLK